MKKVLLFVAVIFSITLFSQTTFAQVDKIVGTWKTIDDETGEVIGNKTVTTNAPITEDLPEEKRSVQSLGFIGQKVGDGRDYLMTYVSQGAIESSFVNTEENYILFTFSMILSFGLIDLFFVDQPSF